MTFPHDCELERNFRVPLQDNRRPRVQLDPAASACGPAVGVRIVRVCDRHMSRVVGAAKVLNCSWGGCGSVKAPDLLPAGRSRSSVGGQNCPGTRFDSHDTLKRLLDL